MRGWILRKAKAKRNAKAPSILISAETPISLRVAIEEEFQNRTRVDKQQRRRKLKTLEKERKGKANGEASSEL